MNCTNGASSSNSIKPYRGSINEDEVKYDRNYQVVVTDSSDCILSGLPKNTCAKCDNYIGYERKQKTRSTSNACECPWDTQYKTHRYYRMRERFEDARNYLSSLNAKYEIATTTLVRRPLHLPNSNNGMAYLLIQSK